MGKTDSGAQPETGWMVPTLPAWLAEAEKARKWLVPGFLLDEAIVCLSGQKKRARKTMLAMATTVGLASGKPFGPWKPQQPESVLFCEEEGQRRSTRERLLAICNGMEVDPASLTNIHWAFHHGIKLDEASWRKKLCEKIVETKARLVVLDAIVYMHSGDENKVADMNPVGDTLRAMRRLGCTVMFLAHLDKARGEDPKADPDSQVRGSGLNTDVYDQHIAIRRYSRDDPAATLHLLGRDQEERKMSIRWDFENVKDVTVRASMSVEDPKETFNQLLLECADKLAVNHKYSKVRLKEVWGFGGAKLSLVTEHLEELRLIEQREGVWWKLSTPVTPSRGSSEKTGASKIGGTRKAVSASRVKKEEEV